MGVGAPAAVAEGAGSADCGAANAIEEEQQQKECGTAEGEDTSKPPASQCLAQLRGAQGMERPQESREGLTRRNHRTVAQPCESSSSSSSTHAEGAEWTHAQQRRRL